MFVVIHAQAGIPSTSLNPSFTLNGINPNFLTLSVFIDTSATRFMLGISFIEIASINDLLKCNFSFIFKSPLERGGFDEVENGVCLHFKVIPAKAGIPIAKPKIYFAENKSYEIFRICLQAT